MMNSVNRKGLAKLILANVKVALLVFIPAWTISYWQMWVILGIFCVFTLVIVAYLIRNDRGLLERRYCVGCRSEGQKIQRTIHFYMVQSYNVMFVLCGVDHYCGWSDVPYYIVAAGDLIVVIGLIITFFVFKANSFASPRVEVSPEQKVISTGPYAILRHPFYAAGILIRFGTPLALGAWWGLLVLIPSIFIFSKRVFYEEEFLLENLPGYLSYQNTVKYRLLPFIW